MDKAYIKVKSITHAIKAKDVLNSNGFRAYILRNTNQGSGDSCGYVIAFDGDVSVAESILNKHHIKASGSGRIRDKI